MIIEYSNEVKGKVHAYSFNPWEKKIIADGLKPAINKITMQRFFTPAEDAILKKYYNSINAAQVGAMINRSKGTVRQRYKTLGLVVDADKIKAFIASSRFKKGTQPWTKGKKQKDFCTVAQLKKLSKARFQKGHSSWNKLPDGAIRLIRMSGRDSAARYYMIKENNKSIFLHRKLWTDANGHIPAGKIVAFIDGNQLNCQLSNLHLITRKQNMANNTIQRYTPEIKKSIYAITSLKRKLKRHEKQIK